MKVDEQVGGGVRIRSLLSPSAKRTPRPPARPKGEDGALKTRGLEAADQFGPRTAGTCTFAYTSFSSFLNLYGRPPRLAQLGGAEEDAPEYKGRRAA